jgi:hypothetical protein
MNAGWWYDENMLNKQWTHCEQNWMHVKRTSNTSWTDMNNGKVERNRKCTCTLYVQAEIRVCLSLTTVLYSHLFIYKRIIVSLSDGYTKNAFANIMIYNYFAEDLSLPIPCLRWVRTFTYPVSNFTIAKNFNHGCNFWMVGITTLIFHMSGHGDEIFPRIPTNMTLWPWPWGLTYLLKTLKLDISFEW